MSRSSGAAEISARLPGLSIKATARPQPSVRAWILVVGSPRVRPVARTDGADKSHPDGLNLRPPFPPCAERCARTAVLSILSSARSADCTNFKPPFREVASSWILSIAAAISTYSKSGSMAMALKRLSHKPTSVQRLNRQCTVRQLLSWAGRSRQGEAVRASHRAASTNSLLSAPLRPRSLFLPGRRGSIRAHCASLRVRLLKIDPCFRS